MGYGSRKYSRAQKITIIVDPSIPTFICQRCGTLRSGATDITEVTTTINNKLYFYAKVCIDCTKLLAGWLKGK